MRGLDVVLCGATVFAMQLMPEQLQLHHPRALQALQTAPTVRVVVMTLGEQAHPARTSYVNDMLVEVPDLVVLKATNGYNKTETGVHLLEKTSLTYYHMCGDNSTTGVGEFESWGTLANFITRYRAIKSQVDEGVPYQAVIEDDLRLLPGFRSFLASSVRYFD